MMIKNSDGERCLQFYYYFTVYDQLDWGQEISVLIKFDNETDDETEIDRVSVVDITENRWYSRNVTFNLMFHFEITNDNRTNDPALNKTIYFALDNIEIYNRNCPGVLEPSTSPMSTTSTTTSQILTTITTSRIDNSTDTSEPLSNNLGVILGLSLGLGIPALLSVIGGVVYYFKIAKAKKSKAFFDIPLT
ncbi:unnamed protein product [Rotaria sp. Silwood1]|nr:unnamed protein product [Rotaria sp. Silwood1]